MSPNSAHGYFGSFSHPNPSRGSSRARSRERKERKKNPTSPPLAAVHRRLEICTALQPASRKFDGARNWSQDYWQKSTPPCQLEISNSCRCVVGLQEPIELCVERFRRLSSLSFQVAILRHFASAYPHPKALDSQTQASKASRAFVSQNRNCNSPSAPLAQ